jgi:hypothetical protein
VVSRSPGVRRALSDRFRALSRWTKDIDVHQSRIVERKEEEECGFGFGVDKSWGKRSIYAYSVLAATQIVIPSGEIEQIPCPILNRLDGDIQQHQQIPTMSFSFGFSGDDVGDDNDVVGQNGSASTNAEARSQFVGLPAEEHSLEDLVGPYFAS